MTKGRIVLVPFLFDDLSASEVRPAVCLTDTVGPHRHIVLAFITTRVPPTPLASGLVLDAESPGFADTGLRVSSVVRLHRLMTVSARLVRRQPGQLTPQVQARLDHKVRELFRLSEAHS